MVSTLRTRREIITLGSLVLLAGCEKSVNEGKDDAPGDNGSRDSTPSWREKCSLRHEIFDKERDHDIVDEYQFSELSTLAQRYFNRTRGSEGFYDVKDTQKAPPEFSYSDVVTKYKIVYDGDVYILGTFSGAGCEVDN